MEIYYFFEGEVRWTANFFVGFPRVIVDLTDISPDPAYLNGHYLLNKDVLITLTNSLASYYYRLCDSGVVGDCENSVSNGFFGCEDVTKYANNANECQDCDLSCDGCFGQGNTNCYECKAPNVMVAGACVPAGPACDSTCLTCSGTEDDECLTCTAPRVLSGDNFCCDLANGFMLQAVTNNCIPIPCHSTCLTCSGVNNNECVTCTAPRVLSGDNFCCDVTNGYEL